MVVVLLTFAAMCSVGALPWRAPQRCIHVAHPTLLVLAGLSQVPVLLLGGPRVMPLLGVLLMIGWTLCNRHLPGSCLLLCGTVANGLAMLFHGGAMPLDPAIAEQLGLVPTSDLFAGSKDVLGQGTFTLWLSDWLLIRLPLIKLVVSPGDLCIALALCRWTYACSAAPRLPRRVLSIDISAAIGFIR